MVQTHPTRSALRVVSNAELDAAQQAEDDARAATTTNVPDMMQLAGFIRTQFEQMRRHRDNIASGWSQRLLSSLRTFSGKYSDTQLAEIKKFGGSDVYARIVAVKCRGASSLLRDVYLSPDRPWAIAAPPDPEVPPEILQTIDTLIRAEVASAGIVKRRRVK